MAKNSTMRDDGPVLVPLRSQERQCPPKKEKKKQKQKKKDKKDKKKILT